MRITKRSRQVVSCHKNRVKTIKKKLRTRIQSWSWCHQWTLLVILVNTVWNLICSSAGGLMTFRAPQFLCILTLNSSKFVKICRLKVFTLFTFMESDTFTQSLCTGNLQINNELLDQMLVMLRIIWDSPHSKTFLMQCVKRHDFLKKKDHFVAWIQI